MKPQLLTLDARRSVRVVGAPTHFRGVVVGRIGDWRVVRWADGERSIVPGGHLEPIPTPPPAFGGMELALLFVVMFATSSLGWAALAWALGG